MARYGLVDDGSGGWEWTAAPSYGLTDDGDGGWEWTEDFLYLLDEDWEWVYAPATTLVAPYHPILTYASRRPSMSVISI